MHTKYFAISFFILALSSQSFGSPCTPRAPETTFCEINIIEINPTQASYGFHHYKKKLSSLEKKYKSLGKHRFRIWLEQKEAPFIVSPLGQFYILDRHHTARALLASKIIPHDLKIIFGTIIKNFYRTGSQKEFETFMQNQNYVFLRNEFGEKISFKQLPSSVIDLADDPMRSFSSMVKDDGGYQEISFPFQEFLWAQYFRERFQKDPRTKKYQYRDFKDKKLLKRLLPLGKVFARSPQAKDLPGYKNDKKMILTRIF
ncbi:MAG: hypothetical protein H6621_09325 [Halobacteriovoraceae bacterium]|nr:hypothetical protein [Halobacteriovoraceae bacterium]MCB9095256.1 hypothetical protein [Halobacteriovoraceae bacterium]